MAALMDLFDNSPEFLSTLGEIDRLGLKEDYSIKEIEDYLATIKEYNVQNGQAELQKKLKKEQDPKEKVRIANEILALKVRREENDK